MTNIRHQTPKVKADKVKAPKVKHSKGISIVKGICETPKVKSRTSGAPKVMGDSSTSHTPPRGIGYTDPEITPFYLTFYVITDQLSVAI